MQVSIAGVLYVIGLTFLVALKPLFRFLLEVLTIVMYLGFIAIGYAVVWLTVNVRGLLQRRGRPG